MTKENPKISIIGFGNVGVRYAYAAIIRGIARTIVAVDIEKERMEGEVIDLSHTAPFTDKINILAGDYDDIGGSDLVVITAGKNQEAGQTRLDIAKGNVELFKKIIPKIYKHAPTAVYLIVSNPVDILSYATYKISGKNWREIIGSGTTLDTARLRYTLADHCDLDPKNIHGYILGEHGDTEVPIWSRALIGGLLFNDYCQQCSKIEQCNQEEALDGLFQKVRDSAYTIIEKKGETSYGIGLSLVRISQAILNNENHILPVSCYIEDYLEINDIYFSLPAILNRGGVREILKLELNEKEKEQLRHSAETLKGVIEDTGLNNL
ncbi:MAG: L-lactate dehydrogenase 1 [Promethearchaeota archaeon]|nr:MAG: L-lactate dehydrogenase 1 [Candidatus Lokiarchaeota archaeon]